MLQTVVNALMELRSPFLPYETDIHMQVEKRLCDAGLPHIHEAKIGPGCRIDFLVGDVGIEIKKGKPIPAVLTAQLERYARCEAIGSIVVLTQRSVKLPKQLAGKPVRQMTLSQLWGLAI
ncbi:MAG: hypothetical protein PHI98_04265 [Eubacteriales bacterium]|nr:hypothetical protein [Eubacteriales bacterium]